MLMSLLALEGETLWSEWLTAPCFQAQCRACLCWVLPYPPRQSGVAPLFELGIRWEAVPHNVRRVILVSQLWTALEQEVYDEELYAAIQACEDRGGEVSRRDIHSTH